MRVINQCRVEFEYRLSSGSPVIVKSITSNSTSTDVIKDILKIDKYVNKEYTYSFDILTYTIDISNISSFIIKKVFFQDTLPKGTRFIENSLEINNIKKRCINPESGFHIGNINQGSRISISFKVLVLSQYFCESINNYSTVEHDYIYNIEKPPTRVFIKSNNVCTKVKSKVFKQLSVNNNIELCEPIHSIINFRTSIEILETKHVGTPINHIYRNSKSNLSTLIVVGSIKYEVGYKSIFKNRFNKRLKEKEVKNTFGFSCNMLVPVGITYSNKKNIHVIVEDVSTILIDKDKIFVNANMMIYY